jgi:hypothetical protein
MIKTLKVSDKTIRKFNASKNWLYSSSEASDAILLEQEVSVEGKDVKIPIFGDIENSIALEQSDLQKGVKLRYAEKIEGTFYPYGHALYDAEKEPRNTDGTYARTIYNSVNHLFYNNYGVYENEDGIRNPMMIFGSETGNYSTPTGNFDTIYSNSNNSEVRILGNKAWVIDFSKAQMGDKLIPKKIKIKDFNSPHGVVEIVDDGTTNLVISDSSLNSLQAMNLTANTFEIDRSKSETGFDYSNLSFGENVDSFDRYVLVGCPVDRTAPTDIKTGKAELIKYGKNYETDKSEFQVVREFKCPFTQSGLAQEIGGDSTNFLLNQLGDILTLGDYTVDDNFGSAIKINENFCAIGASGSHIRGVPTKSAQGHVFIYEKDKGGIDNWGLINIFEGEPDSEFGYSISIYEDYMAIGSPNHSSGKGVVYIYKKTKRTKNHPWVRVTKVYDDYIFDNETGEYKGVNPSDEQELDKINKNISRWKIESVISNYDSELSYIDNSEIEIMSFDKSNIVTRGDFIETPDFAVGDTTWELYSIIDISADSEKSFERFGEDVKLTKNNLFVSSKSQQICAVITYSDNDSNFEYKHIQNITKDGIYEFDKEEKIDSVDFDVNYFINKSNRTITISINNINFQEDNIKNGFVYRINTPLNKITDQNVVTHGGEFVEGVELLGDLFLYQLTLSLDGFENGLHKIYLGLDRDGLLYGQEAIISFAINPVLYETEERQDQVRSLYEYNYDIETEFCSSLDANEKFLIIGNSCDREYAERSNDLVKNKAGSIYFYTTDTGRAEFVKKLYGEGDIETNYTNKFGHSVSILGNDFVVGSPCVDESILTIDEDSQSIEIHDYTFGVDSAEGEFYVSNKSIKTNYEFQVLEAENEIDCIISVNISSIILDFAYLKDFSIIAEFLDTNQNGYSEINGFINSGIFRDKTTLRNENSASYIDFYIKVKDSKLNLITNNDLSSQIDFVYFEKKNAIQGGLYYYSFEDSNINLKSLVKSSKQKYSTRRQTGTSVSLSSNYIFCGSPIKGDFPIKGISTMEYDDIHLFSDMGELATGYGDFTISSVDYRNFDIGGKVVVYDSSSIRDKKKTYVGNVFYKNGIAIISNVFDYFDSLFTGKGTRGFEIEFEGTHTIYENEILCTVDPYEFNVSTNPSSLNYEKIAFDVNEDSLVDISDIANIYKYIMGDLVDPRLRDSEDEEYTVGQETLDTIARQYGIFKNQITDYNGNTIKESDFKVNMLVYIKGKTKHIVKRVESMTHIAMQSGSSPEKIRKHNNLRSDLSLYVGQILKIPSGGEVKGAIKLQTGQNKNWPNDDVILSESEDVILMNLFMNREEQEIKKTEFDKILENLNKLKDLGENGLDIDGDGVVSAIDAQLIARYFVGRRGNDLTSSLIKENSNAKRKSSFEIIKHLDKMTGKTFGLKIKDEFVKFRENSAKDRRGSYLAPYATTIGLYSGTELAMIAKLGRPTKIIPNYPINFLIKYDT